MRMDEAKRSHNHLPRHPSASDRSPAPSASSRVPLPAGDIHANNALGPRRRGRPVCLLPAPTAKLRSGNVIPCQPLESFVQSTQAGAGTAARDCNLQRSGTATPRAGKSRCDARAHAREARCMPRGQRDSTHLRGGPCCSRQDCPLWSGYPWQGSTTARPLSPI